MKSKDLLKNNEDRKGFWKMGYLENADYAKRMTELTHKQTEQHEVDELVEKQRQQEPPKYYDEGFKETAEKDASYMLFATGQKAYRTGKNIIAGFYWQSTKDTWRGVYVEQDTENLKTVLKNQRMRSALEDYTYIYDYNHITKLCNEEYSEKETEEYWANYIGELFAKRETAGEVYTFDIGSYFAAEQGGEMGKQLFFWMERNDKQGARQKGFGLSLIDLEDLLEKWSELRYRQTLDRMIFDSWDNLEEFVDQVAENAMTENWGRINSPSKEHSFGHPVLRSYLEYTLVRLRILDNEQKKRSDSEKTSYLLREDDRIYYNTGLLNKFFRQILIGAELKVEQHDVPGMGTQEFEYYFNPYPIVAGHDTMFPTENGLLEIPKIANYFEKKEDVLYDASLKILLNDEHIFEDGLKAGRIPMFREEYLAVKNNPVGEEKLHRQVQSRMETAIHRAQLLAERNHKLAVPQFWKEDSEVQFLLPLYMEETEYTGRPQCALALRRTKSGQYYEGATILSLDMAYNNARLIAKPDVTWLHRNDENDDSNGEKSPGNSGLEKAVEQREQALVKAEKEKKRASREEQKPPLVKSAAKKPAKVSKVKEKPKEPQPEPVEQAAEQTPQGERVGETAILKEIVSRPSGKGLKGKVLGCVGTVARGLLKKEVPHYTKKTLKVKIAGVNPQGTQYVLEPVE